MIYLYLELGGVRAIRSDAGRSKRCSSASTTSKSARDDGSAKGDNVGVQSLSFVKEFGFVVGIKVARVHPQEKTLHPSDLRRWEENSNKGNQLGPASLVDRNRSMPKNRLKVMIGPCCSPTTNNSALNQDSQTRSFITCAEINLAAGQSGFFQDRWPHAPTIGYGTDPDVTAVGVQLPNQSSLSSSKPVPRIAINSQFLVELAHANYFAMFNEFASAAIEAVNDLHNRACYEMLPEVILVTNAIRNSLHANPSGQPSDGPMGISVALTPATAHSR
ncbi:uncharacterized protein LOC134208924 [Armigeres subalbatus]|uniref:uncharacterized protein LOC134208924 n=1 Tax=Armigeres subalbatus TaxID=124917 RepID=UPI002ED34D41